MALCGWTPPPPGKPEAFWCRGLFLGVEGEGTGKKNRELERWGQEAGERVFPPAISLAKGTSPSQTSPPLACEPRAATEHQPTHPRPAVFPAPSLGGDCPEPARGRLGKVLKKVVEVAPRSGDGWEGCRFLG